ncbi:arylacetamide deacetylase isoform X3 [Struthio camelus]|uniref:arylacetamide deacetylase isoform X3 n=1 Tax=Struthio camelus TaxID=8801 RepID=UPI003603FC6D
MCGVDVKPSCPLGRRLSAVRRKENVKSKLMIAADIFAGQTMTSVSRAIGGGRHPEKICAFKDLSIARKAEFAEWLGLMHYMEVLMLITVTEHVPPTSDENVTVTDTEFSNVPVRLYLPRKQLSGLKRAILYFHGGGWCVGEAGMKPYDLLSRWTSNQLNAVVVSVNYRLAPKYHFPVQFEDVYAVTKFFLQSSVLSQYGVDPNRICVAGDSAGGNLAAAVAQQLLDDPEVKTKLKVQALLYPALQTLDLNLPSYQENENKLILPKSLMVRFWSEYFTTDSSLREAMASNRHVPAEASHLFQFVNWSNLLPEELKKDHVYTSPVYGSSNLGKKYPGFLDPRAAPLLAEDAKLHSLPLTFRHKPYVENSTSRGQYITKVHYSRGGY